MKKNISPFIRISITWAIILLVTVFFARTLQSNWDNLKDVDLKPNIYVLLAIICFVLSIVSTGLVWGDLMEKLTGKKVSKKEAVKIQLASWLLKYIPGQAGSFINKLNWARKKGIDGKKVTASFVYENIFLILASTLTAIPILFISLSNEFMDGVGILLPVIIAIPIVVIILSPAFFTFIINILFKVLKKQRVEKEDLLSPKDNLVFFRKFITPRVINGLAFVLLAESLIGIPTSQYLVFWAIYVLAGIVGLLAIFVPSGLGVREAVIVLFASAYMPTEQAVALSLVARFYATLADLGAALLYFYLKRTEGEVT